MNRSRMAAWPRTIWGWLSLDGRMQLARPGALISAAIAVALAALFPSRWLLYIAYAYLLLLGMAYLWLRAIGPRLALDRRLGAGWAQVGDELDEQWTLTNHSALPLPWLEIDDSSTLPGYSARRVVSAAGGSSERWRTLARCERRGVYHLGPLTARLSDPLGIFRFVWHEGAPRQITVYPPLVRLPALPLPRGARGGLARADTLQIATTPNVGGLRAYVPGDPPARIHWPYVARYGQLFVKEFDQERAGALWLVLDLAADAAPPALGSPADQPAPAAPGQSSVVSADRVDVRPDTPADLAVTLACSFAALALAEGRAIGLLCDDGRRRIVPPAGGARQLWRVLDELVDGESRGRVPLADLLRGGWGDGRSGLAGAAFVVVTPALDAAWLPALIERIRGRPGAALALLVAPDAAAGAPCEALLAAHAIPARSFVLGSPIPLLNPPRRPVKARVSPLGRVIRSS